LEDLLPAEAPPSSARVNSDKEESSFDLSSLKKNSAKNLNRPEAEKQQTDSNRVFVGNLSFSVTEADLRSVFGHFGSIADLHWVTDRITGKFYGTAFVTFVSPAAAKEAIQALNGTDLLNRPMKVNYATRAAVGGSSVSPSSKAEKSASSAVSIKPDNTRTVFIGNLSFNIEEETIRETFQQCGEITEIRWVERDGVFTGCGFIEFSSTSSTDLAVVKDGTMLMGRRMRVDYAETSNNKLQKTEDW